MSFKYETDSYVNFEMLTKTQMAAAESKMAIKSKIVIKIRGLSNSIFMLILDWFQTPKYPSNSNWTYFKKLSSYRER